MAVFQCYSGLYLGFEPKKPKDQRWVSRMVSRFWVEKTHPWKMLNTHWYLRFRRHTVGSILVFEWPPVSRLRDFVKTTEGSTLRTRRLSHDREDNQKPLKRTSFLTYHPVSIPRAPVESRSKTQIRVAIVGWRRSLI
jgi:hypothetical protein